MQMHATQAPLLCGCTAMWQTRLVLSWPPHTHCGLCDTDSKSCRDCPSIRFKPSTTPRLGTKVNPKTRKGQGLPWLEPQARNVFFVSLFATWLGPHNKEPLKTKQHQAGAHSAHLFGAFLAF